MEIEETYIEGLSQGIEDMLMIILNVKFLTSITILDINIRT